MELRKIIVAMDSFKGCLTSLQAANACEQGIRAVFPACEVVKLPMADGGEGTAEALVGATGGQRVFCTIHDPLMRPIRAFYGLSGHEDLTFVELAQAAGLALLAPDERNPLETTTFGVGEMVRTAIERGSRNFLLGIGGSATNDAGTGLLQVLGFRFCDAAGRQLHGCGKNLRKMAEIDCRHVLPELAECRFRVACDVSNPFSGPQGAACVFAPQKGATPDMVKQLDSGLRHFAQLVEKTCGTSISDLPGAGAAGGAGGSLAAFLHASLLPGSRLMSDALRIAQHARNADLIITGEGKIDRQSFMGKALQGIMQIGQEAGVPVLAVGGQVEIAPEATSGLAGAYAITPPEMPLTQALLPETALRNMAVATQKIMENIRKNGLGNMA